MSGPEGNTPVDQDEHLEELPVGDYTLSAAPFTVEPAIYEAAPVELTIEADQTTEVSLNFTVLPGQLDVNATGLPAGANLQATLVGPAPETTSQNIAGAQSFDDLTPGEYLLTYEDVLIDDVSHSPSPESLNLTITSDEITSASTTYTVPSGTLTITHSLPDQGTLALSLTNTLGYSQQVTLNGSGSTPLQLPVGDYQFSLDSNDLGTDVYGNPYFVLGLDASFSLGDGQGLTAAITAPAPTQVLRADDQGLGSLREVLGRVLPGSLVTFAPGLTQVTTTSQITIDKEISIVGPGPDVLTLTTSGEHRLFEFDANADVHLEALRIAEIDAILDPGMGGAILSRGLFSLRNLIFEAVENVGDAGGAIAIEATTGDILIEDTTFSDNAVSGRGGAIAIESASHHVYMERVIFDENEALSYGGAIYNDGNLTISDAIFTRNAAMFMSSGGAIYHSALFSSQLRIERALFADNRADSSGRAISSGSSTELTNVTFFNNTTANCDPAYYQRQGSASFANVTFAEHFNAPTSALQASDSGNASIELKASVIAGDGVPLASDCSQDLEFYPPAPITSLGHNYLQTNSPYLITDPTDTVGTTASPLPNPLATLADNGGFSHTMAVTGDENITALSLPAASCTDTTGQPLTEDQRAETRPTADQCTAGAFQATPIPVNLETFDGHGLSGSSYTATHFTTDAGFTWSVIGARSEDVYPIDGEGIILRGKGSSLASVGLSGGVNEVSVDFRKAFTGQTPRHLTLSVNGTIVATSPIFGDVSGPDETVYTLSADNLNISGSFSIVARVRSETDNPTQIVIDNLTWR
ncbi:hypothetical protein FRC98_20030 [Lujinxingia vulgaris]|uniref:Right handed beta helix domain-containing protein n=1 Tax=Lujinxingia vulgaris TaxID=2600176 RepID=A0A5C6X312_9DELT|nr:hypothetical protein FRC98_20030 [Lujinxingia vulgaris]